REIASEMENLYVSGQEQFEQALKENIRADYIKQTGTAVIQQLPQLSSYIVAAKTKNYVERAGKHEAISNQLENKGVCVIAGPGGAGKSTLVAAYGHTQQTKQTVRWMPAETREKLVNSYEELAT